MAHHLRTLLSTLVAVALATAGTVRGEVLCIGRGGHVAVEALGECEASGHAARDGGSVTDPSCIDIPLADLLAGRAKLVSPESLPPRALTEVVAFVAPVVPLFVPRADLHPGPLLRSALPTRTVVLLI